MITPPVRLFYADDSGAEDTGIVVFSWIECGIGDWRVGLRGWLDLRKDLYARHGWPECCGEVMCYLAAADPAPDAPLPPGGRRAP